jgi:hypothetical protein
MSNRKLPWLADPRAPESTGQASSSTSARPATNSSRPGAQLFQSLTFYWLPGDTVPWPRRKQINNAKDSGAKVEGATPFQGGIKKWNKDVTHIVVDFHHCDYQQTMDWLKKNFAILSIPEGVSLVNSTWTSVCIEHSTLQNTKLGKFRVRGYFQEIFKLPPFAFFEDTPKDGEFLELEQIMSAQFPRKVKRIQALILFDILPKDMVGDTSRTERYREIIPHADKDAKSWGGIKVVDFEWFRRVNSGDMVAWQNFVLCEGLANERLLEKLEGLDETDPIEFHR